MPGREGCRFPPGPGRTARSRGQTVVRSCPARLHYLLPLPAQDCGNPRERPAAHSRGGGSSQQPHGELSPGEKVPRLRLCPATSTTTGSGQSHAGNQCGRTLPGRRIRGRRGKKREREKLPDLRIERRPPLPGCPLPTGKRKRSRFAQLMLFTHVARKMQPLFALPIQQSGEMFIIFKIQNSK